VFAAATMAASRHETDHLRAIVDMGSNGIRFSISTVQPPTARIMPTLYQHRVGISLYDAQYDQSGGRIPIGEATISAVLSAFQHFRRTCNDFGVPDEQVVVLATEATRTAINSETFRERIKDAVGWDVTMLAKEDEGRVGAMGIASSLPEVGGLVMDLGGGSTQLSWLVKRNGSEVVEMPESGSISMPYGAAAMSRRLAEAEINGSVSELEREVHNAVKGAYESLKVPRELQDAAEKLGGFTLYLSGGGFRGWGYVLMSSHRVQPYPIPVINGFKATREMFLGTHAVKQAVAASLDDADETNIFRVSDRRASQVPAVAFLVSVLAKALPQIKEVRFCQGGVREGHLFSSLPPEVRAQHPLVVATHPFDRSASSQAVTRLLLSALPSEPLHGSTDEEYKSTFTPDILDAFANLMYYHSTHSKDLQATSALRSTTSGILAGVHGVLHENRTILALLLCARWGGDVPPSDEGFKHNLEQLVGSPWTLWWLQYIGVVASLIASVYPAGVADEYDGRLSFSVRWDSDEKRRSVLTVHVAFAADVEAGAHGDALREIEKVGKRKRWIGGRDGIGHRVSVEASSP